MRHILFCLVLTAIAFLVFACGQPAATYEDSPTGAYKKLYAAVKSKDAEGIKAVMTKKSLEFADMAASQQHKTANEVLENGFTASTFSPTLPQIRDERINGNMGAIEVYNAKDRVWEDLPLIREDGVWKLAIGDMFAGSYQTPGKSESQKEQEAANALGNNMIPLDENANVNMNAIKPIIPKRAVNADVPKPLSNK